MRNYKAPEIDVVKFSLEDILVVSGANVKTVSAGTATSISFSNGDAEIDFENQPEA